CRKYGSVSASPLNTAVDTAIMIHAIVIGLAVGFVMLAPIGNEVGQRKSVMRSHEINAGLGRAPVMPEQIARCRQAFCQLAAMHVFGKPEAACGVAKLIVPLGKPRRKMSGLIRRRIPRL